MKNSKINQLSDEEIVNAFVFPSELSDDEKKLADVELEERRKAARRVVSNDLTLRQKMLQLKFQLEDYITDNTYVPSFSFSTVLNQYVRIIGRRKKEFASEVGISEPQLSHYLNGRREPNESFLIRLEIHSNEFIRAVQWLKLVEMEKEHNLNCNEDLRKKEGSHVSGRLKLSF